MTEWIGWFATGLFAASYFAKTSQVLKRIQALAACLWIAYGTVLGATPVVAANAIVAVAALTSARRGVEAEDRRAARTSPSTIETIPSPASVGAFLPFAGLLHWRTGGGDGNRSSSTDTGE